jgi:hypothetical protein
MAPGRSLIDTVCMTASASSAIIRQWARDNGHPVGARGRLSPDLLNAYAAKGRSKPKAVDTKTIPVPVRGPRHKVRSALRIPVQPTPGATGIARKVVARSA